jgi:hypothetical protein
MPEKVQQGTLSHNLVNGLVNARGISKLRSNLQRWQAAQQQSRTERVAHRQTDK